MKIGIDLGGSHISIGLVNNNYDILEKRTYYINDNKEKSIEAYIVCSIIHGINEILQAYNMTLIDLDMIGIAIPGSPTDGYIKNAVNLGIKEFNLREQLQKNFGESSYNISIKLRNDGKCAALSEKKYGSLKQYNDCLFLCIGTGIGGAAFINNKFLVPKRNEGFEFGHMVIKKDGELCSCGNRGCFEVYCSKKKFKNKMQKILKINDYIDSAHLITKINENLDNIEVIGLLNEYIDNLAIGISNLINIFEPEAICIGGSMAHYESLIFGRLEEKLKNSVYLFNKGEVPQILSAQAGNDAGIIGATLE